MVSHICDTGVGQGILKYDACLTNDTPRRGGRIVCHTIDMCISTFEIHTPQGKIWMKSFIL